MRPFHEYRVGVAGHELTLEIYGVTKSFPRDEVYGLTSQMRRAASSIPMNIAEGSARTENEFHHFLTIALGSSAELEYQLVLARDLGYINLEQFETLNLKIGSVKRMLVSFMQELRRARQQPTTNSQRPTATS